MANQTFDPMIEEEQRYMSQLRDDILFGENQLLTIGNNDETIVRKCEFVRLKLKLYFDHIDVQLRKATADRSIDYLTMIEFGIPDFGVYGTALAEYLHRTCRQAKLFTCDNYGDNDPSSSIIRTYLDILQRYLDFIPSDLFNLREQLIRTLRESECMKKGINRIASNASLVTSNIERNRDIPRLNIDAITYQALNLSNLNFTIAQADNKLQAFVESVRQPAQTEQNIRRMIAFLSSAFERFPLFAALKPRLYTFGSLETGVSLRNGDLDVVLWFDSIKSSIGLLDFETSILTLRAVREVLRTEMGIRISPENFRDSRRCPIIKFDFRDICAEKEKFVTNNHLNFIECDLSVRSLFSYHNSKLIQFYVRYEPRFYQMTLLIKFWAKNYVGLVGGPGNVPSFTLMMLIVFFLQKTSPPLLPTVERLTDLAHQNPDRFPTIRCHEYNFEFCNDERLIPRSENSLSTEQLVVQFFRYYHTFDYIQNAIIPRDGTVASKQWLINRNQPRSGEDIFRHSFIVIEDPFVRSNNCGSGFNRPNFFKWKNALSDMLNRDRLDETNCVQVLTRSPRNLCRPYRNVTNWSQSKPR